LGNRWGLRGAFVFLLTLISFTSNCVWAEGNSCGCPPEPVLQAGEQGIGLHELRELQTLLKKIGVYQGEINGVYEADTEKAIRLFQSRHGLKATGIIDAETWNALGDSVAGTPVSSAPPPGDMAILVDVHTLTLTVLVDKQPFKTFPVAIGKRETPSPIGSWKIINKGRWDGGFGTRWLGLNVPWGIYGIHGTNKPWSIGRMESHGCVRMFNRDVETLYRWIKVGTPVYLVGDPFMGRRKLLRGERGSDVFFLQKRLRQLGYYSYQPDGIFGYGTQKAVEDFQKKNQMKVTGQIGWSDYSKLQLLVTE
jgi:hypothetical protein